VLLLVDNHHDYINKLFFFFLIFKSGPSGSEDSLPRRQRNYPSWVHGSWTATKSLLLEKVHGFETLEEINTWTRWCL